MPDRILPLRSRSKQPALGRWSKRDGWTTRGLTKREHQFLANFVGKGASEGFNVYVRPGRKTMTCYFYNGDRNGKRVYPTGLDMLDNLAEKGYLEVEGGWTTAGRKTHAASLDYKVSRRFLLDVIEGKVKF